MTDKTALYRHMDRDGNLLYVGISLKPFQRLEQHQNNSHWAYDIASVSIEYFPSRQDAEIAERRAISEEAPAHNIVHAVAGGEVRRIKSERIVVEHPLPVDVDEHTFPFATRRGSWGTDPEDAISEAIAEPVINKRGAAYRISRGAVEAAIDRLAAQGRVIRDGGILYPPVANGYVHPLAAAKYLESGGYSPPAAQVPRQDSVTHPET